MPHRPFILLLALAAGGCSRQPLPPLPDVSTASFLPVVREAVESALRDAKAHPNDAAKSGRAGMVLHAYNQSTSARPAYRRAALLDPGRFDWHYYLGVVSAGPDAITELREALRIRDYLPSKLKLGEALLAAGDQAGAARVYAGLEHPAALFGYGRATNDAAYYERALAVFPQYGAALFALAQHYQRSGRAGDAKRLLEEYARFKTVAPPLDDPLMDAVRALNQGPDSLLAEAATLATHGQFIQAVELQLKALELDPKLTQAHVNLISLYGRLNDAAKAEAHYREAVGANPNAHEAYYNFGVLCYEAHRRAEAEAAFRKAIAINPGYAEAHNNLGTILEEQGRLAEAVREFQMAAELKPDYRLAQFHLGRLYANQRRYADAIEQLERAAASNDEAAPTYSYALGAVYARAGETRKAMAVLAAARDQAAARGQSTLVAAIDRDLAKLKR